MVMGLRKIISGSLSAVGGDWEDDPQKGSNEDLHCFTTRRWLWNEKQQLQNRFTPFDVQALQEIAASSIEAEKCVLITKLGEGGSNRTIPYSIAGPQYYTTASEVATMEFARTVLNIPTPKVLAWCADSRCRVGSEYIIMEVARGTRLADVRDDLALEEKLKVTDSLVALQKKLFSVALNCYGSLYYATENIPGALPAQLVGDIPEKIQEQVATRFVVGPVTEHDFWTKERAQMTIDRGPWMQPQDYVTSLAHREKAWIQQHAIPKPDDATMTQNCPASHRCLLDKYLQVAPYLLPNEPAILAPYLCHSDLNPANIFVSDGEITSVIDWQGVWGTPLMLGGRHPSFIRFEGKPILTLPEGFAELGSKEQSAIEAQMEQTIICDFYQTRVAEEIPLLNRVFYQEFGMLRCWPIQFVGDAWDDDIIRLRDKMGFGFPCPLHFTEDELRVHDEETIGWNNIQGFWDVISPLVARDGFVHSDMYEEAAHMFKYVRNWGLEHVTGKVKERFEHATLMAADVEVEAVNTGGSGDS
ncbi:phosphotransferase family protein [Aspergillus brunneoviolaceus CBS 621.78]|uniref:Phosphotransferase family protein n=1 Tax=Aspergillus brunneoviolaceus CBS 621.78 TaxID=1450534 RepID=A0ACD1G1R0_9EURO|nr:phosphotransferase family protein [Aspergillus brunneoviolaceus CBS 621.78]RAH43212.1 phosphotransferase family protein [Aspergillus brunneoviolaceus CBS 621.78]